MKQSKFKNLLLLVTCAVAISSCDDKKTMSYRDEKECQQHHTAEECRKAFEESKHKYAEAAPKFQSREECEKQFGAEKCVQANHEGGHSMFMPMMMGFMMGRMFGGGSSFVTPAPIATPAPKATPTRRGGFGTRGVRFSGGGS